MKSKPIKKKKPAAKKQFAKTLPKKPAEKKAPKTRALKKSPKKPVIKKKKTVLIQFDTNICVNNYCQKNRPLDTSVHNDL